MLPFKNKITVTFIGVPLILNVDLKYSRESVIACVHYKKNYRIQNLSEDLIELTGCYGTNF